MNTVLELREVRAGYDGISVLHGVDLSVAAGQVVALLGPNGAGKTTTLRVAAGVHPLRSGRLLLGGRDVTGAPARDLARAGVCLIPEGRGVFPNLSVRDNLLMMTFTGRSRRQVEEIAYARFPDLARHASRAAGTLSGGEQQMLALARGLATDPAVLLLDEPVNGLDPEGVRWIRDLLKSLAAQGRTVFVSSHLISEMALTAERLVVIGRGRLLAETTVAELTAGSASLEDAFLRLTGGAVEYRGNRTKEATS